MKNVIYFVAVLCIAVFVSCKNQSLTNAELEAMYEEVYDEHVNYSIINNYSITDYRGVNEIRLPSNRGLIGISNVSGQKEVFFTRGGGGIGVEVSHLNGTVRVCYNDKPFFQASAKPIKFFFRELTIDNNSFAFIHGDHDFQGEVGGLYFNGNLVSQRIMVKGGVPFIPSSVKKVNNKFIIHFESANRASLYALFNEKTGRLTLPNDYETIENDYTTASKKLN